MAVISLAKIGKRIKYIVDSAEFKQGKYTPVANIPIVPPEILEKNEIDAIIVIAGGYSDEVAEIIKENYKEIKIAVLKGSCLEVM